MSRCFRWFRHNGIAAALAVPSVLVLAGTGAAVPQGPNPGRDEPVVESRVKDTVEVGGHPFRDLNGNGALDPYEDWRLPSAVRTQDLLGRMTLEEKAGMMLISSHYMGTSPDCGGDGGGQGVLCEKDQWETTNNWDDEPFDQPVLSSSAATAGIGERNLRHFIVRDNPEPADLAQWTNALQEIAERSRLGIPVMMTSNPRNHVSGGGFGVAEANGQFSTWPGELGMAATRDPALVERFGRTAAEEWRASGIHKGYMYMADTVTEPRWTRASGTFGEDPGLAASMIGAVVRGFQGDRLSPESVSTTTKHFPGGGARKDGQDPHYSWGQDQFYPTAGSLPRYHLAPFQAAIDAGTRSIMPYYSKPRNDGSAPQLPPHLWVSPQQQFEEVGFAYNKPILQGLLRDTMGFPGYVNSDTSITTAMPWGVEDLSRPERFAKAVHAGTNLFSGEADPSHLVRAVRDGLVQESDLDRSVRFLLVEMFDLGLFENPYRDPERAQRIADDPASQAEADAAHRKSVVLLRNDQRALPITDDEVGRVKLYVEVFTEDGAAERSAELARTVHEHDPSITLVARPEEATHAFLAVAPSMGLRDDTGEGLSVGLDERTGIDVARIQQIQSQVENNVVGINMTNPWLVNAVEPGSDAMLAMFDVKPEAVVDVIRGRTNPTGKLPVTVPADEAVVRDNAPDVPGYDEPGYAYVDRTGHAYQFGFGLSYDR